MKSYKRYLSVFVVCLLLFATFSINASADTIDNNYNIQHQLFYSVNGNMLPDVAYVDIRINNNTQDKYTLDPWVWLGDFGFNHTFETNYIFTPDNMPLIKEGNEASISLIDAYYSLGVRDRYTKEFTYLRNIHSARLLVTYTDNTMEYFENLTTTQNGAKLTIKTKIPVEKDIKSFNFIILQNWRHPTTNAHDLICYLGEMDGVDKGFRLSIEQESENTGLLKGVIDWVKNIFNKISDGFETVTNGFTNVVNNIIELPSKLWDLISEGLKNLFVPDEQYMSNFSDKWDDLLSQRFGAIYQVGTIITDFVDRIQMTDKTNTIYMPEVSLNSVGIPFSFGGYDVKIVPDGFNTIVEVCKKIISIVCTFLFVNGLRKKYDEVMGVEQ